MTHTSDNEIRVELKYCEQCGGLWLRLEHSREILCAPCRREPSYTALRHAERCAPPVPARKPVNRVEAAWYGPMSSVVERLQGVAEPQALVTGGVA